MNFETEVKPTNIRHCILFYFFQVAQWIQSLANYNSSLVKVSNIGSGHQGHVLWMLKVHTMGGGRLFVGGDQNFLAWSKGGSEKNGDRPSQTDGPPFW